MSGVFNIGQITQGKTLAEWRPSNRDECTPPDQDAAPAAGEQSPDSKEETKPMAHRAEIRNALQNGPLSGAKLTEALKGANIATTLSQMNIEGQITRSGKGREAVYTLGRTPGSIRKARKVTGKASKKTRAPAAVAKTRQTPPRNAPGDNAKPPTRTQIAQTIWELRLHRDLVDIAISSLEALAR